MVNEERAVRILVVEHDEDDYAALHELLTEGWLPGLRPARATTYDAALEAMIGGEHDVYLVARRLGAGDGVRDGIALLREARQRGRQEPVFILLDDENEEAISAAFDAGADGCLNRGDLSASLLAQVIRHAAERGRSEAARRESEARYGLLFTNMLEGMALHEIIYDEGGKAIDYTILDVNPRFEEILGIGRETAVGRRATAVYGTPEAPYLDVYAQVAATGEPTRFETYFPPMERHFSVSVFSPGPGRFATVFRDVTERKEAERRVREHADRAEALVRVAGRLNAQLDLDNVLNAVCEEAARALDIPVVALTLYDEGEETFRLAAAYGLPARLKRRVRPAPRLDDEILFRDKRTLRVIPDVQARTDLVNFEALAALNARTLVAVSMRRNDGLIGRLNVLTVDYVRRFTEEELTLLQGIADQAAQAISNARLFDSSQRRLQLLRALSAIDQAILARSSMNEALDVVLQQVLVQLKAAAAAILLLDRETGTLEQVAARGFRRPAKSGRRLALGEGSAGRAAQERRVVQVPDLAEAGDMAGFSQPLGEGFVSYVAAPLVVGEEVQGVLDLYYREPFDPDAADPDWQRFLKALATQAAIAIDHTNLLAETRRLLRRTRQQAQQVRQIVDTLPEGVILLDGRHRPVLVNPTAREFMPVLAQLTAANVLFRLGDRPLADLLQPATGDTLWQEVTAPGPDRIFQVGARAISGETGGWVLVVRDVTEARRRQEYLQTQERLATVGQLAAGIAHDFNNILTIITLYAQALEREPELPERSDYLQTILDQTSQAARLIGRMLDFSRSSSLEQARLDLVPFVKETVKLLERMVPESVRMKLVLPDEQTLVHADPTDLQQVLMNLVVNARDAMADGGEVTITLTRLWLQRTERPPVPGMAPGEWVSLTVADTGIGIASEELPHIFEPFYTTKDRGQGTGLGLAQVYGIVKQHDGQIVVDNKRREGTAFTIYLPALTVSTLDDEGGTKRLASPDSGNETILVVEDEDEMRSAIQESIMNLGYRVLVASTGREALDLFDEHGAAIDLVLSDMVMPEMGGRQLVRELHARWPHTRVVLMSGYPLAEEGRLFLERSRLSWIRKPFTADTLARKLRQALDASAR